MGPTTFMLYVLPFLVFRVLDNSFVFSANAPPLRPLMLNVYASLRFDGLQAKIRQKPPPFHPDREAIATPSPTLPHRVAWPPLGRP